MCVAENTGTTALVVPKLILLDFDRTIAFLYEDRELLCKLAQMIREHYGAVLEIPGEEWEAGRDGYFVWHHLHLLAEQLLDEKVAQSINASAEKLVAEFELSIIKEKGLMQGMAVAIRQLAESGICLGMASSNAQEVLEYALQSSGIRECFAYVAGRELPFHPEQLKPSPYPIQKALEVLHRAASDQVWYVGDDLVDLQAAQSSGVVPVGVATGRYTKEQLREHGATYVFESVRELARTCVGNFPLTK